MIFRVRDPFISPKKKRKIPTAPFAKIFVLRCAHFKNSNRNTLNRHGNDPFWVFWVIQSTHGIIAENSSQCPRNRNGHLGDTNAFTSNVWLKSLKFGAGMANQWGSPNSIHFCWCFLYSCCTFKPFEFVNSELVVPERSPPTSTSRYKMNPLLQPVTNSSLSWNLRILKKNSFHHETLLCVISGVWRVLATNSSLLATTYMTKPKFAKTIHFAQTP